ncbi:MAG: DUF6110 family protein [Lachnospiraceae bacterium]|nr:DUF6110 family protein [Lachnospiraceae bacterium]
MSWSKVALFVGGALFGSAGVKILSSKDAKKVYTHCTAAALRAKDVVVDQATTLQENCTDIYEEAKMINEERELNEAKEIIEDEPETDDKEKSKKTSSRRKARKTGADKA